MLTLERRSVLTSSSPPSSVATLVVDSALRLMRPVPWPRAVTMVVNRASSVLVPYTDRDGGELLVRSPSTTVPLPFIAQLVDHHADPYADYLRSTSRRASTRAILDRDGHECAYCGGRATTRDHVLPRSRGGADSWDNLVAACVTCNNRKDDRTPGEAGMPLQFTPSRYDGYDDLQAEVWAFLMARAGVSV